MHLASEQAALAAAGVSPQRFTLPHATIILGDQALVVIVDAGDRPGATAVRDAGEIVLSGVLPGPVGSGLGYFNADGARLVLAYIRLPDGLLPVGPARVASLSGTHDGIVFGAALRPATRLTYDQLDLVRPAPAVPLEDTAWLDLMRTDRIAALRAFIATWHAATPAGPVAYAPPTDAPEPLRTLYEAAEGRKSVLGAQNFLRPPAELTTDNGWVAFADENQGAFVLEHRTGDPDPVVRDEIETLSGVLLQFVLFEASFTSPMTVSGFLSDDELARLTALLRRVPLGPASWIGGPARLYAGPGLIVAADRTGDPDGQLVTVGANHRAALRPLRDLDLPWFDYDG
ncbi:hypothetical protein [Winogradskya humida]|uniref:Uncharacterized protein n=1 Tax=Winogradskya humida TaxID=113566 RepID=A0ABQ3ZI62_9ACTN|nr:hypothetical protein [Actinoplanes humidus]GIE18209.1 hypothetical protein Ahu01nite_013110 [Actinoplanes humidus]